MPDVPIFDSLTHPMPDGNWLAERYHGRTAAEALSREMKTANVRGALAVGMGRKIGGYTEESYADFIRNSIPGAYPVAWFDFQDDEEEELLRHRLKTIRGLGYIAIKIHPRFAGIDYTHPLLPVVVRLAHSLSLPVLLCTYNYEIGRPAAGNTIADLLSLVHQCSEARIILLHGGVFHLLELAEFIRPYPNLLLDLSFTMCRYAGSSLDLDIRYLFRHFDRRICIGSDHPEFSLETMRQRFDSLAEGLPADKERNIAHVNILRTLNLPTW